MNNDISKITVEDNNSTKYLNINEGVSNEFNEPAITIKHNKKIKLILDLNFEKIGSQVKFVIFIHRLF